MDWEKPLTNEDKDEILSLYESNNFEDLITLLQKAQIYKKTCCHQYSKIKEWIEWAKDAEKL